ncbi:MAG: hypothetical protein AAFW75_08900 [Cyanobacteria bacterium J06636_16]
MVERLQPGLRFRRHTRCCRFCHAIPAVANAYRVFCIYGKEGHETIQGEYELRRLLARQPAMRSLIEAIGAAYVANALGLIKTADGGLMHRWMIELNSPEAA